MVQTGFNTLRVGDFAWKRLEPQEGRYQFQWLDDFIDLASRKGVDLLLVPPLRCAPAWMIEKDPTVQMVNESGVRLEFGSRYTFCINHPRLRQKGLALAEAMATRYSSHANVIGWHLDNEYGDEPDCHCDLCRARWHQWLEKRYGTIDDLNRQWGMVFWGLEFDHFGQVPTPRLTKTYHQPALLLNWRRFRSDCTVELVEAHAQVLRRHVSAPITTNLQNQWNARTDYTDLARPLDHLGMNYYPPYGKPWLTSSLGMALLRGLKAGANFEIHELRNGPHAVPGRADNSPEPGEIERLVVHCIGHGADGIYFFQWGAVAFGCEQSHGTLVGYDGRPKRAWHEAAAVGAKLKALAPFLQGTRTASDIAVLHDYPTRWATQGGVEWVGPPGLALDQIRSTYSAVRSLGHNCDAIGTSADFSRYRLLIVPMLTCVDDVLAQRLCDFVEKGGTLLWHPLSGIKDPDARIYPRRLHPALEHLFGLSVCECATMGPEEQRSFRWRDRLYAGRWFADLPEVDDAQVLGQYEEGWIAGKPAMLGTQRGSGRAIYLATFADEAFYRDLLLACRDELDLRPILDGPVPPEIELIERRDEGGRRLVFMINSGAAPQRLMIRQGAYDHWSGQPLSHEIAFEPWQARVVEIQPSVRL
jgi:beta-galactosidase